MKVGEISIEPYYRYSSGNYGIHSQRVKIGEVSLWFSYDTVIAFEYPGKFCVMRNYWGSTTGKHLNSIDGKDKDSRVPRAVFEKELATMLKKYKLGKIGE